MIKKKIHFSENHMFGNPGNQLSIHLMNFYNSQLSGCKQLRATFSEREEKRLRFTSGFVPSPIILLFATVCCCGFGGCCFFFSVSWAVRGFVYCGGRDKVEGLRPEAAMRAPASAQTLPVRRGDLCPFVSCDTRPVFVLKFIHDGYVSLPIACAGSPAERTDKLFSAAGLAGPGLVGGGGGRRRRE